MYLAPRLFFYFNLTIILIVYLLGFNPGAFYNTEKNSHLAKYYDQKITLSGRICQEAEIDYKTRRLTICLPTKILITTNLYPEYNYGDVLEIKGLLQKPGQLDNFDYGRYLGKNKIYFVMYYPELSLIKKEPVNSLFSLFYATLLNVKQNIRNILSYSLNEPAAGLAKALFLGDRRQILEVDKKAFANSGLSHLIAISGTHLAILSALIIKLTSLLRLSRAKALKINILFLIIYPVFTGLSASAIRAGLMGVLVLIAFYEGRLITSVRALVFSAALMLIFNPRLLRDDIGFQLSYAAILGIIYLYPLLNRGQGFLKKYFSGGLQKLLINLQEIFSLTLACQLSTWPILLSNFQQLSLVSILANLLVIWLFPVLFIFLIIPLLPTFIFPNLGVWFFAPAYFCLNYILKVAHLLASQPNAIYQVEKFSQFSVTAYYLFLGLFVYFLKSKQKNPAR